MDTTSIYVHQNRIVDQFFNVLYTSDLKRVQVLLRFILWTLISGSALICCIAIYANWIPTITVSLINLCVHSLLLTILREKILRIASILIVTCMWLSITYIIYTADGIHDVGLILYPIIITIGSLIFNRLHFIILSTLCVLAVGFVGIAEILGHIETEYAAFSDPGDVAVAMVLITLSAILIRLMTSISMDALKSAYNTERQYREIFNKLHDAIFIHDPHDGTILDVNDTVLAMYGYQRDELQTFTHGSSKDASFTNDRALEKIMEAHENGSSSFRWHAQHKDGHAFWVDVILQSIEISGQQRVVAIIRNVDQELQLEEQLRQSEKLTAIGELAGGIAHDFNNMLMGIIGAAEILSQQKNDPQSAKMVDLIINTSERAAELTSKLLSFAKKRDLVLEPAHIHNIIDDALEILKRSVSKGIHISTDLSHDFYTVEGDRSELTNVFLNLGVNACDAMGEHGTIRIESHGLMLNKENCIDTYADLEPGQYIEISIQDNGPGIPEDIQDRIFEPFFSTKDKSQRTGLGLSAVYGIIEKHNGNIRIANHPDGGAHFTILLPAIDNIEEQLEDVESTTGTGRILIIDDEEMLLTTTSMMLEKSGYACHTAKSGLQGIEAYKQFKPDLILLDMLMPDMSGTECFHQLMNYDPNAKIIICSGYPEDHSITKLIESGARGFLNKPYRLNILLQEIDQAIA